jgi:hypothetical protein
LVRFDFVRIGWSRVRLSQNTLLWVMLLQARSGYRADVPAAATT